ncbi:hypothetical protein BDU57DRAFT_525795 [Ampelomyces quisqualis]|uniref:Uncharacterized protein n=1 Tax=Ampelomyces quisqualis TaxID=50730 RepID=A0A6A5QZF8_AMPQU|nr:hypothetical protein BDU57DRAFT_525795 [Ampelomyces quisqualis]
MARLPQHNEASPCWPTYIGATGYAAHLAAVESQPQAGKTLPRPAEIATPRTPESDATTIHAAHAAHQTTPSPSPPPPPPKVLSPPAHESRHQSTHALRCVHAGRCAVRESIQIVDGSPEVLEEMRVREGKGRGGVGEEDEKKKEKKKKKKKGKSGIAKLLKKVLGEGARRVALGLWARGM